MTKENPIDEKFEDVRYKLDALDLGSIKVKLASEAHGEGWTAEKVEETEKQYKRFLFLNHKYRDRSVVTNKVVDTFWHYHILDTLKYHEDCDQVFGYYIHHFPYFGMRGDDDAAQLEQAYKDTLKLYEAEYGTRERKESELSNEAQCADVCTTPCDSPTIDFIREKESKRDAAQCADVCTTPCDSPAARNTSLERPVWVSA